MATFTLHDIDSSPEQAKSLLESSQKSFGMIPNLHAVMATSPQLLKAYQQTHELFSNTSFDKDELTVVWQTINVFHECHYCVPAHTAIAKQMGADDNITSAIKNQEPLRNKKWQTLRVFTESMLKQRGHIQQAALDDFFAAGYTQQQILEIILGIAQKTMSNYTNSVAATPLDEPFKKFA